MKFSTLQTIHVLLETRINELDKLSANAGKCFQAVLTHYEDLAEEGDQDAIITIENARKEKTRVRDELRKVKNALEDFTEHDWC